MTPFTPQLTKDSGILFQNQAMTLSKFHFGYTQQVRWANYGENIAISSRGSTYKNTTMKALT
jgi:hypothetical protein